MYKSLYAPRTQVKLGLMRKSSNAAHKHEYREPQKRNLRLMDPASRSIGAKPGRPVLMLRQDALTGPLSRARLADLRADVVTGLYGPIDLAKYGSKSVANQVPLWFSESKC